MITLKRFKGKFIVSIENESTTFDTIEESLKYIEKTIDEVFK